MYFCPNCNNVFDITKTSTKGGAKSDISDMEIEAAMQSESSEENILMGGAKNDIYTDIITKLLHNGKISDEEIAEISLDNLVKSSTYKKLKHAEKEVVYNKLQDLVPLEKKKVLKEETVKQQVDKAYFICNNCGYMKPIPDGTLIFSKVSTDIAQSYSSSDFKDMIYSDILPRTRKYICPNTKCESHSNPQKKEASFFRMNNNFKVKYVCQACGTIFS